MSLLLCPFLASVSSDLKTATLCCVVDSNTGGCGAAATGTCAAPAYCAQTRPARAVQRLRPALAQVPSRGRELLTTVDRQTAPAGVCIEVTEYNPMRGEALLVSKPTIARLTPLTSLNNLLFLALPPSCACSGHSDGLYAGLRAGFNIRHVGDSSRVATPAVASLNALDR